MTFPLISGIVITIAILILIGFAVAALIQLRKTLEGIDTMVTNVDKRLDPLLNDLHELVKQVDMEIGRLDDVIVTIRDIGDKVSATTRIVHEIVSSPLIKAASVSAGAREAIKKLVKRG